MKIYVKKSTIIRPAQETPKHLLPSSVLDLVVPQVYVPNVFFYRRPNDSSNFLEAGVLKESLSKVLVPFYPIAGRLEKNKNGGVEVQCNGEGVLFTEAETSCVIDDLGDFSEGFKLLPLVPSVDDIKDISSRPLMVIQVTHFKCGGFCLGVRSHHILGDGISTFHFTNSWAEITCGLSISTQPFFDRTILSIGVPPSPTFHHIEYDPSPSMNTPTHNMETQPNPESISTVILKLSLDQMNILKEKCKGYYGAAIKYSRFEIVAAHLWRCVCKARGLSDDQASKLHCPTNGRFRLNPQLPSGYFGNVIFTTTSIALSGDIYSEPLNYTVERIHNALNKMDDKYLKSALAYLQQQSDPMTVRRGAHMYKSPNLNIVNLLQFQYAPNFGWGKPFFVRPVNTYFEGQSHIIPSPTDDGSLSVIINLETQHAQLYKKLFYAIFMQSHSTRSRY